MSTRDRRTPTPQLALRVAAFGIVAFGVFAVLFLRLWFLQILQGDDYLAKATENKARVVRIAAPRGFIVDRNKQTLVENKVATVVTLQADAVPTADRDKIADWGSRQGKYEVRVTRLQEQILGGRKKPSKRRQQRFRRARAAIEAPKPLRISRDASPGLRALLERYSPILKTSPARLYSRVVSGMVRLPWAGVALKTDVSIPVRNFLLENQDRFPGLTVTKEYLRHYPGKSLASQIFGNVSQISEDQLKEERYRGLRQGQRIGQDGIERRYDSYLRGEDGEQRVEVDSLGRPTGAVEENPAKAGYRLRLTLDERLQRTAQFAIQKVIRDDPVDEKTGRKAAGAFVAMDPRNGELLAIGSYPSVDLNVLNGGDISIKRYRRLTSERSGAPMFNRAIAAGYPTGSTFKIVTASAGLANGVITPEQEVPGGACRFFGANRQEFCNAGKSELPAANLWQSLQFSSDVYYYDIGAKLFPLKDQPLQTWARLYGFGRKTGIDIPGEESGTIPDAAWRRKRNAAELACRKQRKVPNCYTVFDVNGSYLLGDNVNLSIGQGDLQATPLQVAESYAGLYDRPDQPLSAKLSFPTPHIGWQIETADGRLVRKIPYPKPRTVRFDALWKREILRGLGAVTSTSEGTAAAVFNGWDQNRQPVFGKTGTAQRCKDSACPDQAWFAAMVPDAERPIVVVATIENGGFGTTTAAPVVCRVLRQWYEQTQAPCEAGQPSENQ
ncbi:penicillin-binding transpeptidase domain-containing protein [Patulibacter defluvii]|uniref:penicillin-binding transpeptidase domain-containing protein n=1 Tax=Patulibacter defluvii TaxID=3095358 RepID=UPI002A760C30|nr:penicillin-binding transpeptidase domain-containing protein [Patulibacter sp. DM4]